MHISIILYIYLYLYPPASPAQESECLGATPQQKIHGQDQQREEQVQQVLSLVLDAYYVPKYSCQCALTTHMFKYIYKRESAFLSRLQTHAQAYITDHTPLPAHTHMHTQTRPHICTQTRPHMHKHKIISIPAQSGLKYSKLKTTKETPVCESVSMRVCARVSNIHSAAVSVCGRVFNILLHVLLVSVCIVCSAWHV